MRVYLAGAESGEYQRAVIEARALSLQTFYAPASIAKLVEMARALRAPVPPTQEKAKP